MEGSEHTDLSALKPLYLTTNLVLQQRAECAISTPEDDAHQNLAQRLANRLQELTDAEIPVSPHAEPARCHVIALGQMANNLLIENLYWNRYLFANSLWPGPDGWFIQTVHNPYPWTTGHNVIVLGGSDSSGVDRAVDAFLNALAPGPDLSIPYTLTVHLPDRRETRHTVLGEEYTKVTVPERDLLDREARELIESDPPESLLAFQEHAARYLLTGQSPHLQAGKNVLLQMCEIYGADPRRKMTWPEETNARYIFAMWDAVEEAPVFNDGERLRITGMLLKFLHTLVSCTSDYDRLEDNNTIVWNHTTFPLMGLYWGGRYFRRYYDLAEMDIYLQKARGAFRGQEKSWKSQCDADEYLTLTIGHTIEYALAEGSMTFFESDNIRKYADYLIGISDNRGRAAGFGDSSLYTTNRIPLSGVPYAFWYTQDPHYLGYLNTISGGEWLNPYHQDVEPASPQDHLGVRVYPLDRQVYEYTIHRPYYNEPSGPPNIPFEQAFDKIAFRAGPGETDQYFLLDGYARGKHYHYDGNAILKLTHGGEDWLIDADYLVRNTTEHTMVSVVKNGRVEAPLPECAGLLHQADLPEFGFTETVVRDYNGVDWYRDIFWKKGDWIVVFDRLRANTDAEYCFDCVWKTLDRGDFQVIDRSTLTIRRPVEGGSPTPDGQSQTFLIVNASEASLTLRSRIGTPGPVKLLTQRQAAELDRDAWLSFQNLLYLDSAGEARGYRLQKLDERSAILKTPKPHFLGTGSLQSEELVIEAGLFCIGPEKIALGGAVEFQCGGVHLKSDNPISLEIDTASGEALISTLVRAEIARSDGSPLQVQPGQYKIMLALSDRERDILSQAVEPPEQTGPGPAPALAATAEPTLPLQELWRVEPDGEVQEIRAALPWNSPDRPGAAEILVCQGNKLKCYGPGPTIYWTFTTKGLMRCVTTADLDNDGQLEILCGGNDEQIHILDKNGRELRSHHLTEQLIVGQGGTQDPFVNVLLADDLNSDGAIEIVAGCTNSQISMFDAHFNRIWNRGGIYHGVRKIKTADLAGDGGRGILAADHYGSVHLIGPSGDDLGSAYSELGDVAFDVGDINGDGYVEITNGSGTGVTAAFDHKAGPLWQFNNHGYNTREIVCHDLDNSGCSDVLIASDTGYVYALDGNGEIRWQTDLKAPVVALAKIGAQAGKTELAAGLANGELVVLNTTGKRIAAHHGGAPVKLIVDLTPAETGIRQIAVVDAEDRLRVLA